MSQIQNLTLSDTSGKTIPCDWLLCSSDFRDIILIPCDLDEVDIDDQSTFEQPARAQIQNAYFSKSRHRRHCTKEQKKTTNLDDVWLLQKRHSMHTANCILLHDPVSQPCRATIVAQKPNVRSPAIGW